MILSMYLIITPILKLIGKDFTVPRRDNLQDYISDAYRTLKGHQTRYERVELNQGCNNAKFERAH